MGNIVWKSAWDHFHHMTSKSLPPSPFLRFSRFRSPSPVILAYSCLCHDRNAERSQLSAAGDSPLLGLCDLSPSLSISMPSIGITVEQYWRSIKGLSLSLSLASAVPFTLFFEYLSQLLILF